MKKIASKKKNRNSIVRVIISNFDDKKVKEIKVVYNKQAGVDVLKIDMKDIDRSNKNIDFKVQTIYNMREEDRYSKDKEEKKKNYQFQVEEENGKVIVKKTLDNGSLKKYSLALTYEEVASGIKVKAEIEDLLIEEDEEKRRKVSQTERILLDKDTMEFYKTVSKLDEIDSKEIYKINRFLDYRSQMLGYYSVINYVVIEDLNKVEKKNNSDIWNFINKKQDNDTAKEQDSDTAKKQNDDIDYGLFLKEDCLNLSLHKFIENHNNRIRKKNNKIKKDNKKEEIDIEKEEIKEDMENIVYILDHWRHAIFHYNYEFFSSLYSGEDIYIDKAGKNLSELLNLNMFDRIEKIDIINKESRKEYLGKNDNIYLLGEACKGRRALGVYNDICDRKKGFNKFVNNNIEKYLEANDDKSKKLVEELFNSYFDNLKKREKDKRYRSLIVDYKELKKKYREGRVGRIYYRDIHDNLEYREFYQNRQRLVELNQKNIYKNKDTKEVNAQIEGLNKKMKEITDLNSRIRLQFKLQFAFGYIKKRYGLTGNLKDFKNGFGNDYEKDSVEREEFIEIMEENYRTVNRFIVRDYTYNRVNIFDKSEDNNLVRFYILIYNLLPQELKGNFLGFVKKNYYDVKHVDFIREDMDLEARNKFFHNLRLFEMSANRLGVFKYSISDIMANRSILSEKFEGDIASLEENDKLREDLKKEDLERILKQVVIKPIMRYYQIAYKLINDIEIELLYTYLKENEMGSLEEVMKKFIKKHTKKHTEGYYNFREAVTGVLKLKEATASINDFINFRNVISHINKNEMFGDVIKAYFDREIRFSSRVEEGAFDIEEGLIEVYGRGFDNLSYNLFNDYYMKKQRLLYSLRKDIGGNRDRKDENRPERDDEVGQLIMKFKSLAYNIIREGEVKTIYINIIGSKDEEKNYSKNSMELRVKSVEKKNETNTDLFMPIDRRNKYELSLKGLERNTEDMKKEPYILKVENNKYRIESGGLEEKETILKIDLLEDENLLKVYDDKGFDKRLDLDKSYSYSINYLLG